MVGLREHSPEADSISGMCLCKEKTTKNPCPHVVGDRKPVPGPALRSILSDAWTIPNVSPMSIYTHKPY